MKTSLLKKDLVEQTEFFIEYKPEVPSELSNTKCIDFVLQPDKLKVKDVSFYLFPSVCTHSEWKEECVLETGLCTLLSCPKLLMS